MPIPKTVQFDGQTLNVEAKQQGGNTFVTITDLGKVAGNLPNIQNSHAVMTPDGTIYVCGLCGLCPGPDGNPAMVSPGTAGQTMRTMKLLEMVLHACGATKEHITIVHAMIVDNTAERFKAFNEAYLEFWGPLLRPARITTGTSALLLGAEVEIDCIAKVPASKL